MTADHEAEVAAADHRQRRVQAKDMVRLLVALVDDDDNVQAMLSHLVATGDRYAAHAAAAGLDSDEAGVLAYLRHPNNPYREPVS